MRHRGILRIEESALLDAMAIPRETNVIMARVTDRGQIELVIEHDDLKPIPEGHAIPVVGANIVTFYPQPERKEFKGWVQ